MQPQQKRKLCSRSKPRSDVRPDDQLERRAAEAAADPRLQTDPSLRANVIRLAREYSARGHEVRVLDGGLLVRDAESGHVFFVNAWGEVAHEKPTAKLGKTRGK